MFFFSIIKINVMSNGYQLHQQLRATYKGVFFSDLAAAPVL